MLSQQAIEEIIGSREKLTEFSTVAMVKAVTAGLARIEKKDASPNAIAQFIETLRKVRADLSGVGNSSDAPQMQVNIQFGQSSAPVAVEAGTGQTYEQPAAPEQAPETPSADSALQQVTDLVLEQVPLPPDVASAEQSSGNETDWSVAEDASVWE